MSHGNKHGRGLLWAAAFVFAWGMALSGLSLLLRSGQDGRQTRAVEEARDVMEAAETAAAFTPEPEVPTSEPETPTPEPEVPTSEPETPTPEQETPAPEPETPAPEPVTPTPTPVPPEVTPAQVTPVPEAVVLPGMAALQKDMPDLAGWLKVRTLYQIDFPVVKRDNTFYLNHDITGAENASGAAFMDEYNVLSPRDDNLIIYAHNKSDGSMFGSLFRLGYREFVSEDPITVFSTLYEEECYIPVAVYEATVGGANDFDFMTACFSSPEAAEAFIAASKSRSYLEADVDCGAGDRLLTLATCIDGTGGARLVVLLRALREGETEESVKAYYRR